MFTVNDICTRYGVSEKTVLRWIGSGDLKAMHIGQRMGAKRPNWRVTQAALDAFEQSRTQAVSAPRERRRKPADVVEFYK